MSTMLSYQITSSFTIWTDVPIADGATVYFVQYKGGSPFGLKKFGSYERALDFFLTLRNLREKWHRNMAFVNPPFQVEGGHYLALEKLGVSLATFLESSDNRKLFCAFNTISEFYQTILKDLLLVVHHLKDSPIKSLLNLNDVCIFLDGKTPHITLTNFKLRESDTNNDDWKELGELIGAINKGSKYGEIVNEEMKSLLCALENPNRASLEGIARNTLFLDLVNQRGLMCKLSEYTHVTSFKIYNEQTKEAFGPDPRQWTSLIGGDEKLQLIKTYFDVKMQSKESGLRFEREDGGLEKAMVDCINFIGLCYLRPLSLNRRIEGLGLDSVEDVQSPINAIFPNHVWILSRYLLQHEESDLRCLVSTQENESFARLLGSR